MAKIKKTNAIPNAKKNRVATSPEARENQLISLAVDLAEQQLRDGTASSRTGRSDCAPWRCRYTPHVR